MFNIGASSRPEIAAELGTSPSWVSALYELGDESPGRNI
jgi:hypothetical protein